MKIASKKFEELEYYKRLSTNLSNIYYTKVKTEPACAEDMTYEVSDAILIKAAEITLQLDPQPDLVCPTMRNSMQIEWDLDDNSYLEFEIFDNIIKCMKVPKSADGRDYNNASFEDIPFSGCVGIIKQILRNFILTYTDDHPECPKYFEED